MICIWNFIQFNKFLVVSPVIFPLHSQIIRRPNTAVIPRNCIFVFIYNYFVFDGNPETFIGITEKMSKELESFRQKIQDALTNALSKLLLLIL